MYSTTIGDKQIQHTNTNTSHQLSNMLVEGWQTGQILSHRNSIVQRTVITSTAANLQKIKESRFCNAPVNIQTSTQLKCCQGILREHSENKWRQTSMKWLNNVKNYGFTIPPQRCERLINDYFKLFQLKVVLHYKVYNHGEITKAVKLMWQVSHCIQLSSCEKLQHSNTRVKCK